MGIFLWKSFNSKNVNSLKTLIAGKALGVRYKELPYCVNYKNGLEREMWNFHLKLFENRTVIISVKYSTKLEVIG